MAIHLILAIRKPIADSEDDAVSSKPDKNDDDSAQPSSSGDEPIDANASKHIILVTNSDGIESPGLSYLVEALVREGIYNVHVVVPQSDKSTSGHSLSMKETEEVASAEVNGVVAYEVSAFGWAIYQMRKWKAWENETRTTEYQYTHDCKVCFLRQFVRSVPKVDYMTLRHGFIIGIIVTGMSYWLQAWVIEKKGPVFSAIFGPLALIIAAIFSAIFLHETFHWGSS
ncbi:hypothetical protein ACS0TY_001008 [Phlomoides rotata]